MNILLFYHSLLSDWNHGNAHFLRGITTELLHRGHNVRVYEPADGWSYTNWKQEKGEQGMREFKAVYPQLDTHFYDASTDFDQIAQDADLVIVHEWNDPELVKRIGRLRKKHSFRLLFHDTHHRSATTPEEIEKYDLTNYDGVLAFGEVVKKLYLENKWTERAWVWHEAADTRVFRPLHAPKKGDLIWIGNWGDNERTEELREFLIEPVRKLGLKAKMYGVRYPGAALELLQDAGIEYGGYIPSYRVPEVFGQYKLTVHVPRAPYVEALPGIPTIRPFEALACGIPLVSSPWRDTENLFRVGTDFRMARSGEEMTQLIQEVIQNPQEASSLVRHGLETIRNRHTCAHRVDELLNIYESLTAEHDRVSIDFSQVKFNI